MDLNGIVFPRPDVAWNYKNLLGKLVWIPAKKQGTEESKFLLRLNNLMERVIFVYSRANAKANLKT